MLHEGGAGALRGVGATTSRFITHLRTYLCFHGLILLLLLFLMVLSDPLHYLYSWLIIILGKKVFRVDAQVLHEVRLFLDGEALCRRFY